MSEWQPIETAPKDGKEVLLWAGRTVFGYWQSGEGWMVRNNGNYNYGGYGNDYPLSDAFTREEYGYELPTHWQPMPKEPK